MKKKGEKSQLFAEGYVLAGGKCLSPLTVSWEDFLKLKVGFRTDSSEHIGPNPLKQHEGEEAEHFVNGTYVFFPYVANLECLERIFIILPLLGF